MISIDQLETPIAVVDLDRLATNIQRLQAYLDQHGIHNRPHIKTHKIPAIAQMQLAAGAVGITCQKLGEAEVMADAGINNIFLPYNIVGPAKRERLSALARRTQISVTTDAAELVPELAAAARAAGVVLPVLVECDTGMGRCGVQSPQAAAELARMIARSADLHFGGLMTYPLSAALDSFVTETRALLDADGLAIERVSSGGTSTMWQVHEHQAVTEHRAGMYVYGDRATIVKGAMSVTDCALHVLATVVSRPTADRGILDAGSKTLTSDLLGLDGHGLILEYPDARIYALSEEHGMVDFSGCASRPAIGDRVTIIPNHCCVVSNLFDVIIGVRDGQVAVTWPVAARGRVA